MIPVTSILFDGVMLTAPVINHRVIEFPCDTIDGFGSWCGAGDGIGNWLVPEIIHGKVKISVACYIHDYCRAAFPRTEENFIHHNRIFRDNMQAVIDVRLNGMENINTHLAASQMIDVYFGAVQKFSHFGYFKKEKKHGREIHSGETERA